MLGCFGASYLYPIFIRIGVIRDGKEKTYVKIQQNKSGGKFNYAISRIFLPYDFLKSQYPVLEDHKWLMPACQCARWFKRIFISKHVPGIINELKANNNVSKAEFETTAELLKKLGL